VSVSVCVCGGREDKNCLAVKSELPTIYDDTLSPGQRFTPDEQCKELYGRSSYYCAVSIIVIELSVVVMVMLLPHYIVHFFVLYHKVTVNYRRPKVKRRGL